MKIRTPYDLLWAIRTFLPNAQLEEDNDGQLVIYTGIQKTQDGKLTEFKA